MKQSLNKIPLLRLLLPFVLGIITAVYLKQTNTVSFYLLGIFTSIYFVLLLIKKTNSNYNYRWLFGVLIHLNIFLAAFCLTTIKSQQGSINTLSLNKTKNQFLVGELIEAPVIKTKSIKAVLNIKGIKSNKIWQNSSGKIVVYLQKDSLSNFLTIGDVISFEPHLENVPPPKNPNEFDYRKYLSFHLIHQQAFLRTSNWKLLKKANNNSLFVVAQNIRKNLINTLNKKGLKGKELAVASALILGYKDDIDTQLKSAYSSAGAMHILAVSGLHVGVIFLIFSQLFQFFEQLKYGKIIKGFLLIIVLWSYALLTGLSPSVMRAATMFSFIVIAKTTNRNSNFFNTLAASAFALLIYNPLLLMEVGFQLSYLAVIGIVIIQPWVYNFVRLKWWLPDKIWGITAVSIAAQIATFPLGLLYFHQFPNYFLLSNLIVIPLAILILYLGLITLSLSWIPLASDYLAIALKYIIEFLNWTVNYIDKIPYSLTKNIRFSITDTYLIYLVIIFLILLITYRKFKYFLYSSVFISIFLVSFIWIKFTHLAQHKLIVYNIPNNSAINFIDGDDNILLSDIKLYKNTSKLLFHVQNNWINTGVKNEKIVPLDKLLKKYQLSNIFRISNLNIFIKQNYLQFYGKRIAILDNHFKTFKPKNKLIIDYLILTKNTELSLAELLKIFTPKYIILDSSNSNFVSKKIKDEAKILKQKCWSVNLDGAYTINI